MIRLACPVSIRLVLLLAGLGIASPALAQNWSGDARHIAMGGVGTGQNLASSMVDDAGDYRTIVVPLGLIQVLRNLDVFRPDTDSFDPVRSVEYAAAPLHYTLGRDGTGTGSAFVNDILDADLSFDLNDYRGFVPITQPVAYGLANPSFGVTIPVYKSDGSQHGAFVGIGPYLAFRGGLEVGETFIEVFGSDTPVYLPNAALPLQSDVRGELAVAFIGGYRGRFALGGFGLDEESREGIYVAVNYNLLRGFRYENSDINVRLDTDAGGMLTLNLALPPPVQVLRQYATAGRGHAIDLGAAVVVGPWEFGGGVNGLGNRILWTGVRGTAYTLGDVVTGGGFNEEPTVSLPDVTVRQPIEYTGNVGYDQGQWAVVAQVAQRTAPLPADEGRFTRTTFRTGFEYRLTILEPRVGISYSRERWRPSAGVGLNFGRFGVDGAVYWMDANIQRVRHPVFALSLRFGSRR